MESVFLDGGLLKRHLNKYLDTIHKADIYPVVIGGTSLKRCTENTKYNMPFTDIDLKFVIAGKDNPVRFKKAMDMRHDFFTNLMADPEIKVLQDKHSITFELSDVDMRLHGRRQVLNVIKNDGSKYVLIDTLILSEKTFEYYHHYKNFLQKQKIPFQKQIPVYVVDGIPYSTCYWTYFDTIRMLYSSKVLYERNKASFFLTKYIKYLAKFIAMYSTINNKDNKELFELYNNLRSDNSKSFFHKNIDNIQKTLDDLTNLKNLIKMFVVNPDYEDVASKVMKYILKKIIGKYMKNYFTDSFYPVISGGANMIRCKGKDLTLKDIDIFFIYDCEFKEIFIKREQFLNDIINDEELQSFLDKYKKSHSISVKCTLYTPTVDSDEIVRISLSNIIVDIYDLNDVFLYKKTILDCSLLNKQDNELQIYKSFSGIDLNDSIPFIRERNVFFATCSYLDFNARIMVHIYRDSFKRDKDIRSFIRLVKYLEKFYILIGDKTTASIIHKLSFGISLHDQSSTYIPAGKMKDLKVHLDNVFKHEEIKKLSTIYKKFYK